MANHLFDALHSTGRSEAPAAEAGDRVYTYADIEAESARLANALVTAGVRPGDRVAVQVEKSAANLFLYLAAIRAGAVYLPLNTAYTLSELSYFLGDAEPRLVVCDPTVREQVTSIAGAATTETLDRAGRGSLTYAASGQPPVFNTVARAKGDLAAICYTSGTTGRSKGAMLSHGALVSNAETLVKLWRFAPSDVLIHALPFYHVHGLFVATHVIMMAGGSMILQPKFEADAALAALPRATALMGVPTFYTRLLAHPALTQQTTAAMRLFISGSAPLLPQTHEAWRHRTGHVILERYGMTETGMNTSNPYDGERIAGTVGPPLPDVALRIVDQTTGQAVESGVVGVIEVKGPNVCSGYWRNEAKTAEAFTFDGWFVTGDLGVVGEAGYVSIVGREKDLIISGGLNVYPKEVEEQLDALSGVIESAIIGVPHADLGEAVVAVVAIGEAANPPEEPAIMSALAQSLAGYKRPKRVIFVADLPRNTMGKIEKARLRERYERLFDA